MIKNLINRAAAHVPDALLTLGGISIAVGAWMVSPPAGFIVGGLIAMAAGWFLAREAS